MQNRNNEIIKVSFFGILGNIFLVAAKAVIGFLSSSVSIVMDALNNLTDALSSIITIIGTKLSGKKADKKHPYGHGRIEYITATAIGALILFAGIMAIIESVKSIIDHFQNNTLPEFAVLSIVIIGLAIFVKVGLGLYYKKMGAKLQSDNLKASGTDALFDAILSTSTLVGAIVAKIFSFYVEGYLGIIIGIFILKGGFEVISDAMSDLIGKSVDDDFKRAVRKEILTVPNVISVHDLIIHNYGNGNFIASVHVTVDINRTAAEIQEIERNISFLMYEKFNIIMTTGIYVFDYRDDESKKLYQDILSLTQSNDFINEIHGFYVDKERHFVTFDVVVSFKADDPNEIKNNLETSLKEMHQDYSFNCNIDMEY